MSSLLFKIIAFGNLEKEIKKLEKNIASKKNELIKMESTAQEEHPLEKRLIKERAICSHDFDIFSYKGQFPLDPQYMFGVCKKCLFKKIIE